MAEVQLRTKPNLAAGGQKNPLPSLLHTPSGFALLELQGTINLPSFTDEDAIFTESQEGVKSRETPIGRLVFPDYEEGGGTGWMKRVYLYAGKHQRLTGEVKKLPKPLAVIRKVKGEDTGKEEEEEGGMLEVVEIVKYKILFSIRPEPVGTWAAAEGGV